LNLLDAIEKRAAESQARVAIGVGRADERLVKSALLARVKEVVLVVNKREEMGVRGMLEALSRVGSSMGCVEVSGVDDPSRALVAMLARGEVDGCVRGNLSAGRTLGGLKKVFGLEKLYRAALLETPSGGEFLLAPVGIDEGVSLAERLEFIRLGTGLLADFGVRARLAVLSGGRLEDVGRDPGVDRSLAEADFLVNRARERGIPAIHPGILIEEAVKNANFILAPDGVNGNLIFRTLTLVGGGKGHGAPLLNQQIVFVDTSRAKSDYTTAIMLAAALTGIKQPD